MDKQEKPLEVKEAVINHSYDAQDFQKEYELLCKKMGMLIVPSLVWTHRDDNSWSTICNLTVGKLPQES